MGSDRTEDWSPNSHTNRQQLYTIFESLDNPPFTVMNSLSMNSSAGNLLMKNARLLQGEEGEEKENNHPQYDQYDVSWMKDFSIKFLGCHHVASWNSNAQEDNDVRIQKQRFVRFRLCQTNSCSSKNALGCSSGYGDYVVGICILYLKLVLCIICIYTYSL